MLYDPAAARHNLERALELRSVHLDPHHPKTLATMHQLGKALRQVEHPKALEVLGDLVSRSQAAFGPNHRLTLEYNDSLAEAYEKAGRFQDALGQREESLRGRRQEPVGSNDLGVGYALREVARLREKLNDYTRAEILWREALPLLKTNGNVLVDVQASFGQCLLHTGKPADAEAVLRQCLVLRQKKGPDDWETFLIKFLLGTALLDQKKYAEAETLLLAGFEGMKKALGMTDKERQGRLIENAERLVQLYEAISKKDKADAWRKQLQEVKQTAENSAKP